jgi:hypothetical protein
VYVVSSTTLTNPPGIDVWLERFEVCVGQ